MTPTTAQPPDKGAFFTLSLLFDRQQIDELLHDCWPQSPRVRWDKKLLERLQDQYVDSTKLHGAINPMFDDIADRARNLFLRDFLLDTPSADIPRDDNGNPLDEVAAVHRNVCANVALQLDHTVKWQTEGRALESILLGAPIRFDAVLCRAFWMAHSNEALSYHLSFEVPYRAELAQYFGLSMLQKMFFNTEGTEWLLSDGGARGWQASADGQPSKPLLSLVEDLFEAHLQDLLSHVGGDARGPTRVAVRAWQRLVLRRDAYVQRTGTDPAHWAEAARHRRLLVVLRDATVFDTLEQARSNASLLAHLPIDPSGSFSRTHHFYKPDALTDVITRRLTEQAERAGHTLTDAQLKADAALYELSLFLSGFLQNIVDFLQQDGLEVHDALMPEYPPADDSAANQGFMIYATPSVVYEVVGSSRSLEGAGRQWIGTCPYIFLVHMTAFHNESLVLAYENNVSKLVDHLQAEGLSSDRSEAGDGFEALLDHAFESIRDFRLVTFEQVHKHYSFNVFRYDTEKQFFSAIEEVRGVVARREYWDKVLEHLTGTIDGLKQNREARFQRTVGGFGLLLTAFGLTQTWLAVFPLDKDAIPSLPLWAHGLALLVLLVALGFVFRFVVPRRHGGRVARAWRSHGEQARMPLASTAKSISPSR
jgi:hypothetical protein